MRQQTIFVTIDGRQFQDAAQANTHEDRLFEVWLKDNPRYADFIKSEDASCRNSSRAVLQRFFLWNCGK
jgi:hypothetical protein